MKIKKLKKLNIIIPDLIFNFDYKNDLIHEKVNDFYCEIEETNISEMIYYQEIFSKK